MISASGTTQKNPNSTNAGAKPPSSARRSRGPARPVARGTAVTAAAGGGAAGPRSPLGGEDFVEGIGVALLVLRGALDRHLQTVLGLVVEHPVAAVLVALVDEDL